MSEPLRAVLIDIEGVVLPMAFMTETLMPLATQRLGSYIVEHAEDEEVEEALEETGRLMGGYDLEPAQAESLLLRWMKQGRKATPLKILQGLVWQEAYDSGRARRRALSGRERIASRPGAPPAFACSSIPPIRKRRRSSC